MFNLLTGGARFDRKRDGGAIDAFKSTDPKPSEEEAPVDTGASGASSSAGGRKRKRKGAEPVAEEPSESQLQHTQEQQQSYRHRRGIHVSGDDVPAPAPSFASLSACAVLDRPTALPASAAARLKLNISTVGFIDPTPIQAQALPVLLEGRDLLAGAPTGSGKTAAFVLPIIAGLMLEAGVGGSSHHHTHHVPGSCTAAVIVAPTLELAGQIHRQVQKFLRKLPLTSQLVDTVASSSDVAAASDSGILADGQSSGGTVKAADIVVGTPISLLGAFQDSSSKNSRVFLNLPSKPEAGDGAAASAKTTKKGKKKSISSKPAASTSAGVRYLVLDEADRLFDLGFVTQIDSIFAACSGPLLCKALFSATLPFTVEELARSVMTDPVRVVIGERSGAAPTVNQKLLYVGKEEGKILGLQQLYATGLKTPALLFVQSKERANDLYMHLNALRSPVVVDVVHADRSHAQREQAVKDFRSGRTWLLITTDLMARGLDFPAVKLVINYDFPQSVISYIHRIGRTGRAGREGEAVTLYTDSDLPSLKPIANVVKNSGCDIPEWMTKLGKMRRNDRKKLESRPVNRKSISKIATGRTSEGEKRKGKRRKFKGDHPLLAGSK